MMAMIMLVGIVVNIPFAGQAIKPPYVCATIVLDGADIGLFHLIQEIRITSYNVCYTKLLRSMMAV